MKQVTNMVPEITRVIILCLRGSAGIFMFGLSFSPRLQPGVGMACDSRSRFNGFSLGTQTKTVETVHQIKPHAEHRAEATV